MINRELGIEHVWKFSIVWQICYAITKNLLITCTLTFCVIKFFTSNLSIINEKSWLNLAIKITNFLGLWLQIKVLARKKLYFRANFIRNDSMHYSLFIQQKMLTFWNFSVHIDVLSPHLQKDASILSEPDTQILIWREKFDFPIFSLHGILKFCCYVKGEGAIMQVNAVISFSSALIIFRRN